MAKVTIDHSTGEVVIRASMEEAMAVEAALVSFTGCDAVDSYSHGIWDGLDDIRESLMKQSPSAIPLEIRRFSESHRMKS